MALFPRKHRPNDYLVIDDQSGFTVWASDTVKEWTGLRVRKQSHDPRHPQEQVRAIAEKQTVPDPRPPGIDRHVGPLRTRTTAAASASAQTVSVASSARFLSGDRIMIALENGDFLRTTVSTVDTGVINFTTRLPGPVASGAEIVNMTAVSAPIYE